MSQISVKELSTDIKKALEEIKDLPDIQETGVVTRVCDGIVWIYGLRSCGSNELLEIEGAGGKKVTAFALNLSENEIGAVLLGDELAVSAGARVKLTGELLSVPVGPELVGRVVDPLGRPLDGKGPIKTKQRGLIENTALG
ncbi:MAG: F0F1 ATP synthase subunit alpha, partial [Patescibacteria group bacterium]